MTAAQGTAYVHCPQRHLDVAELKLHHARRRQ